MLAWLPRGLFYLQKSLHPFALANVAPIRQLWQARAISSPRQGQSRLCVSCARSRASVHSSSLWGAFSSSWNRPGSGLFQESGDGEGPWVPAPTRVRSPRQGARPPGTSGRSPSSTPAAPPPSPNFLPTSRPAPLGAPLLFPHELFSSERSNQRTRTPPGRAPTGWRGSCSRAPLPPGPGATRPRPGPASARPTRLHSLPPSHSVGARAPTLPGRPGALSPAA